MSSAPTRKRRSRSDGERSYRLVENGRRHSQFLRAPFTEWPPMVTLGRSGDVELFGKLVRWGNPWTPGANWATTFEVDKDVTINGNFLPKGKYAVWMIPRESEDWTVIFHRKARAFHVERRNVVLTKMRELGYLQYDDDGDFEDLLELAIQMFQSDEFARERFWARYKAFTVDEYQDVNLLQESLLERWLGDRDELCVVGDDYQTIYAFTGASPEHLLDFTRRFPHATVVRLEENYRSTPEVLELANRLAPRLGGIRKTLRPHRPSGPSPVTRAEPDEGGQALPVRWQLPHLVPPVADRDRLEDPGGDRRGVGGPAEVAAAAHGCAAVLAGIAGADGRHVRGLAGHLLGARRREVEAGEHGADVVLHLPDIADRRVVVLSYTSYAVARAGRFGGRAALQIPPTA